MTFVMDAQADWVEEGIVYLLVGWRSFLGKKYYYELSDLRDLSDEEAEKIVLRKVLSQLVISDFRKLKSKRCSGRNLSDMMKQIILSKYVQKDDTLDDVSDHLVGYVDSMILKHNNKSKENKKITIFG